MSHASSYWKIRSKRRLVALIQPALFMAWLEWLSSTTGFDDQ